MSWFQQNLGLPLENRRFIFNIWGQGGVGKTTLSKEFIKIAAAANWVTAYVNEDDRSLPEIMGRLVAQLEQPGVKLAFSASYKTYRQKKQELEADPEAPQGFSAFLGRSLTKAGLGLAKQIPGSGAVMPFVDEDGLTTQVSEWSAYVAKKLTNKDEVRLVQEPVEVLTPLFLEAIAKVAELRGIALFFDTYERTADVLDDWLRDLCEGRYGAAPENLIVTIAGRNPLDPQHWSDYDPAQMPLGQFTEAEARQFLGQKGITDERVIEVIFSLSDRLPVLLALLASNCPTDPAEVGDCSGSAVQRFLQWETDPQRRQLALDGALPLLLNRDVVAVLAGEEQAIALFDWLKQMPFVEARSEGWVYHEIVRSQMLRYKRQESPKEWAERHGRLADEAEALRTQLQLPEASLHQDADWQRHTLTLLYHRLCQAPQKYLSIALNEFLVALKEQRKFAERWANQIFRAGRDSEKSEIRQWGKRLVEGLQAYDEGPCKASLELFSALLASPEIEAQWQHITLAWRGNTYQLMEHYEEALKDFDLAIELDPKYGSAIANRGRTYHLMGRYEEALKDFDLAIELNPKDNRAFSLRGRTYRRMKHYEEALKDFDMAIELDPKYTWSIASRGQTYRSMKRYEEALKDFDLAIELNPKLDWALAYRGRTYHLMQRYQEALRDFDLAIELNPKYAWAILNRGRVYRLIQQYQQAILDFNRAIELDAEDDWYLYERALSYQALNQIPEAQNDLKQAIRLAQQEYSKKPEDWRVIFNLALYYLTIGNIEQARFFYRDAIDRGAPSDRIQVAIEDLEDFLTVFPDHAMAKSARDALKKRLNP
jgi:tetratricopeptide (TPR) repeat protein